MNAREKSPTANNASAAAAPQIPLNHTGGLFRCCLVAKPPSRRPPQKMLIFAIRLLFYTFFH